MARRKTAKPRQKFGLLSLLLVAVVIVVIAMTSISPSASVKRNVRQSSAPTISSVSPSSAKIGDTISIRGKGFEPGTTSVYLGNGVVTNYLANSSSTSLNVYVPDTVCQPPLSRGSCKGTTIKPGTTYKIYVTDAQGRKSNELTFTVKR